MLLQTVVVVLLGIGTPTVNAGVLLWSDQELRVNPLVRFTLRDLFALAEGLERPDVHIFQSPTPLSGSLREVLNGYYTAYTPNGYLESENITYLMGDGDLDVIKIREVTSEFKSNNILFAINIPAPIRSKRETEDTTTTESPMAPMTSERPVPNEPVVYRRLRSGVQNGTLYALLYSSKPLLLKRNDSDLHLGNTADDMIVYDTRLNVRVKSFEGNMINLRFLFAWTPSGYWSLSGVKITDVDNLGNDYSLTTSEEVTASGRFSYHCNGRTVFSDGNGVELTIYDIQVQPDSRDGRFDDANDCVPFTTVPIWSGLFVTAIICVGLIVALTAILDIKTMDKFDNCKTKNLAITVSE